jgi:hypothetical protein
MLQISAQQLAELLSGIARAQAAIVHGLETGMPGTRGSLIVPALQNSAHLRDHPDATLVDLPVRILLGYMGRVGPDTAVIARELERIFSGSGAPAHAGEFGPVTLDAPAADAGDQLDFSKP